MIRAHLAALALALLTPLAALAAPCSVRPGAEGLLIEATVLTPGGALPRAQVAIDAAGAITCVGRCSAPRAARIVCPGAVLTPGFINLHEHADFADTGPPGDRGVRYTHRHDWRKGTNGFTAAESFNPTGDPRVMTWGELRHLLAGETATAGGTGFARGLLRNLDYADGAEGLPGPSLRYDVFPLKDVNGIVRRGDCDYGPAPMRAAQARSFSAYLPHVAEGAGDQARNEFACLTDPAFDTVATGPDGAGTSDAVLGANTAIVHGVALDRGQLATAARLGVKIVWSPRSNLALYGRTLDAGAAAEAGVTLALGTDWLFSGSVNLKREIACARQVNARLFAGRFSERDLWAMVTVNAAQAAGRAGQIGVIAPGAQADLVLVAGGAGDPYAAATSAGFAATLLILRGGRLVLGEPGLARAVERREQGCEPLRFAGAERRLCMAADAGVPYAALSAAMAARGVYPALFEGVPPKEPPCDLNRAAAMSG